MNKIAKCINKSKKRYLCALNCSLMYILFISIIHSNISAQKVSFEPGYVVLNSGERKSGLIKRTGEHLMSKGIEYQELVNNGQIINYKPADLSGFVFTEEQLEFRRLPYYTFQLDSNGEKVKETEERFGKILLGGSVMLFKILLSKGEYTEITNNAKSHVYMLKVKDEYIKLSVEEEHVGDRSRVSNKYIGSLLYAFSDCPSIRAKIISTSFNDRDIVKITKEYLECMGQSDQIILSQENKRFEFKHQAAASYLNYDSDLDRYQRGDGFSIGYGFEFRNLEYRRNAVFSAHIDFGRYSFSSSFRTITESIIRMGIGPKLYMGQNKVQPYIGVNMEIYQLISSTIGETGTTFIIAYLAGLKVDRYALTVSLGSSSFKPLSNQNFLDIGLKYNLSGSGI